MRPILSAVIEQCRRHRILVLLAALAVTSSGCKLKVYVPTSEGHVESKSGAFYCSLASLCDIDIVDTSFEETFRAVPKQGYVFAGWKDRPEGLYGNSIEDAYITTAVLAASETALDVFASDTTYYLEPKFIEVEEFEWRSRGDDVLGTKSAPVEHVELSADGDVYAVIDESAVGIPVSVYEWAGSRWRKRGDATSQAETGAVVDIALSRDGTVLAYSSRTTDRANEVRVFKWTGREWDALGEKIRGEYSGDHSGVLALSEDGTVLAIGAPANPDGGGADAGHARIFSWEGGSWEQLGEDIDGTVESMFGSAVGLSASGRILAVGAPAETNSESDLFGTVSVYVWNGSSWSLRGEQLQGYAPQDGFGIELSLSASGNNIAVTTTDFYARVFAWQEGQWIGRGRKIETDRPNIQLVDVDISDSGGIIAVSEPKYGMTRHWAENGRVRVLIWDGSKWVRLGGVVFGDSECEEGYECIKGKATGGRLNADGSVLAMVDSGTGSELSRGGRVRVFTGRD